MIGPIAMAKANNRINRLEAEIMRLPPANIVIVHHFTPGIYAREMRVSAGSVITGKVHKTRHLNIVSAGRLTVRNELGDLREISAPFCFVSEPGTRRAAIVLEDAVWITVHPNPDDEHNPDVLEARLVEDANNPLIVGMTQPKEIQ